MTIKTRDQRGITLLELLVGTTLGIVIAAGVIHIYVSNKNSYRMSEGVARLQENSRFALDFLRRGIELAGFPKSNSVQPIDENNSIDGGSSSLGDEITINFIGSADCLSNPVTTTTTAVQNRLHINQPIAANVPSLYCDGSLDTATSQPIVEGVDHMQIQYGIDSDGDQVANRYVNITTLNNDSATIPDIWLSIISIRVALLMNTVNPVKTENEARSYQLLDGPLLSFNDRLGRSVITTTIPLRNRID